MKTPYTEEYKRTRCVQCGLKLSVHRKITAEDVRASKVATPQSPVNGFKSPLSETTIGQWIGHAPMPWTPKEIAALPDEERIKALQKLDAQKLVQHLIGLETQKPSNQK